MQPDPSLLEKVRAYNLFASPLHIYAVKDAQSLNAALLPLINARRAEEAGVTISNELGWHSSSDFFLRQEPAFRQLAARITQALIALTRTTVPDFDLAKYDIEGEGWINVNDKGAFNSPHVHGEYLWSGCYYVSMPQTASVKSGMIEFIENRQIRGLPASLSAPIFSPKFQVRPQAGMLLIFPSYLQHWVYPNLEEDARISIAFNAKIVSR